MRNSELIGVWLGTDRVFDNGPDRRCVIGNLRMPDKSIRTLKGYASEDQLQSGVTYRFFGHNRNHPKFGPQFNFNSFVEESAVDEDSVLAYLETCRKPERGSITRRVAIALFEAYGVHAIDCLIEDPVAASQQIKQWDAAKASIAAEYLKSQLGTQRCKLELITLLNGRGFPKKTMDRAIKEWGAKAAKVIRDDPYELMTLAGIGFKGADKLYCDIAREDSATNEEYQDKLCALKRQGLCAAYAVSCESRKSGSTWIPVGFAKASIRSSVSSVRATPDEAIEWAVMDGRLTVQDNLVAVTRNALHELEISEFVTGVRDGHDWPSITEIADQSPEGKPLSDHQLEAIQIALNNRVCCLQGSPGVGKTFAVACIVKALIARIGINHIGVAAPTGKAAVRMTQSMAANGVEMQASTIHRLLQVEGQSGGDGWTFRYNAQEPLPYRFLILDEMSMTDVDLMASLIRACTSSTHILLVGDTQQLAPVGHGRPFFDLQKVIPTGHLTEIMRNSGRIVQACAEIRDTNTITFSPTLRLPQENMPLIQVPDEDQVAAMENLLTQIDNEGEDVIEDCQVLTGKNDGSSVARKPLNTLLQKMLNPSGRSIQGNPFRIGDKIVCLKNGQYQDSEDRLEQHFVANGELGRVIDLRPNVMTVRLCDPIRTIAVIHASVQENEKEVADSEDIQKGAVGDWDLGYVLSVHRSQGSQWKWVIYMLDSAGAMVQTRNAVYTAISRAVVATFVIGQRKLIDSALRRDGISGRKTLLTERIQRQRFMDTVDHEAIFAEV